MVSNAATSQQPRRSVVNGVEGADVIVVGAGTAGCVAARALVDRGASVVLFDAGPGRPVPATLDSFDGTEALAEAARFRPGTWVRGGAGRRHRYRRGWGIGGGSAVNTLIGTWGDRSDYDRWEHEYGAADWSWATLAPHVAAVEQRQRFLSADLGPLATAVAVAAGGAGHPVGGTSRELDRVGLMTASLTATSLAPTPLAPTSDDDATAARATVRRWSVLDSELATAGPGLEVVADTPVRGVAVRSGRAVGVELSDGSLVGGDRVVLAAGALDTPLLLRRSGLAGPDVGGSAEDHPSFVFTVALRPSARNPLGPVPAATAVLRWGDAGELMALVMDHVGPGPQGRRHGAVVVSLTDVASRGGLVGSGPDAELRPGWLDAPDDLRRLRSGVRHIATLLDDAAVSAVADGVFIDDVGTRSVALDEMDDAELDRWLLGHPGPVSHIGCTAPLGGTTVGADGVVAGAGGLHVVDASVLPHLPNANPNLPVMAVARRLAAEVGG